MYVPEQFKNTDLAQIYDFCEQYGFATVLSSDPAGMITANHFPLIIDRTRGPKGTIIGHMARSNSQWKAWSNTSKVLCIFNGPNRYISPSWYQDPLNVPTWNYAVVHLSGTPRLIENPEAIEMILNGTVHHFESIEGTGWKYELPKDFKRSLTKAIVGFEIEITDIEAKFKLSQNRSEEDRHSAIRALSAKQDDNSAAMVELMEKFSEKETE